MFWHLPSNSSFRGFTLDPSVRRFSVAVKLRLCRFNYRIRLLFFRHFSLPLRGALQISLREKIVIYFDGQMIAGCVPYAPPTLNLFSILTSSRTSSSTMGSAISGIRSVWSAPTVDVVFIRVLEDITELFKERSSFLSQHCVPPSIIPLQPQTLRRFFRTAHMHSALWNLFWNPLISFLLKRHAAHVVHLLCVVLTDRHILEAIVVITIVFNDVMRNKIPYQLD